MNDLEPLPSSLPDCQACPSEVAQSMHRNAERILQRTRAQWYSGGAATGLTSGRADVEQRRKRSPPEARYLKLLAECA